VSLWQCILGLARIAWLGLSCTHHDNSTQRRRCSSLGVAALALHGIPPYALELHLCPILATQERKSYYIRQKIVFHDRTLLRCHCCRQADFSLLMCAGMTPRNRGRRVRIFRQVLAMAAALVLLCFLDIWTLQALTDPLHPHLVIAQSRENLYESSRLTDSPPLPSLSSKTSQASSSLVNHHALLQVHVSVGCTLDSETSMRLFQKDGKESVLDMEGSWFIMITELHHSNLPMDSIIHLDQAVDLTWLPLDNNASYKANASLSFLIPLITASGERTLIITLMEHFNHGESHSRIATRRLANLPMAPSSTAALTTTKNSRKNPVVTVHLSTSMTCVPKTSRDGTRNSTNSGKSLWIIAVLIPCFVVYSYTKRSHCEDKGNHFKETAQQHVGTDKHVSVSPARLRRGIVIDSPGSDGEDSTAPSNAPSSREHERRVQDSSFTDSSAARSRIVKPPSLVRIPFSFVAEQEREDSTLSVDSTEQTSIDVGGGTHQDAFPSPVVDVKETATYNSKQTETKQSAADKDSMSNDTNEKIPANKASENPTGVCGTHEDAFSSPVVNVKETPAIETDLGIKKDTSQLPEDSYKTPHMPGQDDDKPESRKTEAETNSASEAKIRQQVSGIPDSVVIPCSTALTVEKKLFEHTIENDTWAPNRSRADDVSVQQTCGDVDTAVESHDASTVSAANDAALGEATDVQPGLDDAETDIMDRRSGVLAAAALGSRGKSNISAEKDQGIHAAGEPELYKASVMQNEGVETNQESGSDLTVAAAVKANADTHLPSSKEGVLVDKENMLNYETPVDTDANHTSTTTGEQQRKLDLSSKVIDLEYVSVEESNWLLRLRDRPAAIHSSSSANEAPSVANVPPVAQEPPQTSNAQRANAVENKGNDGELSYVSTLPPDSDSNDGADDDFPDFSFDSFPNALCNPKSAPKENLLQTVIRPNLESVRPSRRKRRLNALKAFNFEDQEHQESESLPHQLVRPDKTSSRKHKNAVTSKSTPLAANVQDAIAKQAKTPKPRPKKPMTETIVPDVVPSTFLQSFAQQIDAPVPWDFTKTSARHSVKKEKRSTESRRRKRKGPPSTIVIDDSPVPPRNQHSVVSRGSSRVQKTLVAMGKTPLDDVSGKRRRLKK